MKIGMFLMRDIENTVFQNLWDPVKALNLEL